MEQHPRLWKQLLIQQLSQNYHAAQKQLYSKNLREARTSYLEMIRIYRDIARTDLSHEDKQVAHFCVQTVYEALKEKQEEPPLTEGTFRVLFSVSIIILLIGLAIVMKPTIVGLITLDTIEAPEFTGSQTRFFIHGQHILNLEDMFESSYDIDFLVTKSPTVDVEMFGANAKFIPVGKKGISRHTILAVARSGSVYEVTRIPIEIIVQ